MVADLVDHLESYLGEILYGSRGDDTTPPGVQVVWFGPDAPWPGVTTIATLGLSKHHLREVGSRGLHQELLMHLPTGDQPVNAAGVLFQIAAELIDRGQGILRGEVIGPRGRLFDRTDMTAVYAAIPVYLPDGFAVCETPAAAVVFTWLVPITTAEAAYIRSHGWPAFEEALLTENPDLSDPARPSISIAVQHQ
jgi:Suppressor of fused protein (SUFU)